MLTGQAKTDYQREYMRRRRAKSSDTVRPVQKRTESVRPATDVVRPEHRFCGVLSKERQLSKHGFNK